MLIKCESFKELISKTESFVSSLNYHKVNIHLEINNSLINNIQKAEKNIEFTLNNKSIYPEIKFVNQSAMFNNKSLVNLTIDFRRFKQVFPANIENKKENVVYQEIWPLPDDIIINKNTKTLPKKRAHPCYIIGNEIKFNLDIPKYLETDHYDINDRDFIIRFLENYPDLKLQHLKLKLFWELYIMIQSNDIPKKSFAIMKIIHKSKELDFDIENETNKNVQLSDFVKKHNNVPFVFRINVLPYNFKELISIISKFESSVYNKSELIIYIDKYLSKIPYYYKPQIIQFLEKRNFGWRFDDKFLKVMVF